MKFQAVRMGAILILSALIVSLAGTQASMARSIITSIVCPNLFPTSKPEGCPLVCLSTMTCTNLRTHTSFQVCRIFVCFPVHRVHRR
jgi:hypothetical protein